MRLLAFIFGCYWLFAAIQAFKGNVPDPIIVGMAFLATALWFFGLAID